MGKRIPVWLDADGERSIITSVELHNTIGGRIKVTDVEMHETSSGTMGAMGAPKNGPLETLLRKHVTGFVIELQDESGYFERPGEICTSSTILKARTALCDSGLSDDRIEKAMEALQKAGILLREKGEENT